MEVWHLKKEIENLTSKNKSLAKMHQGNALLIALSDLKYPSRVI
jgi:hypothetical protein